MGNEIKVSVVIPVYNAAPYLRQCLDSVIGQTLREIEIICVDDGSGDESPQILDEYRRRDDRVMILTQKNLYAGTARNNGLEHASGEYIIFWDADDYFAPEALELMYGRAKETQADLCVCNAQNFDSQTGTFLAHSYVRKPYPETDVFSINDCKYRIYTFTSTVAWNKLVRRQFMLDENIRFQTQQHINDVLASLLILSLAKRITICNRRLIFYRMNRKDSLMSSYGEKLDSVMTAYEETQRQLSERGLLDDPEIRQSITDKAVGVYFFTMPYVDNYGQYLEYFARMTSGDEFLKMGEANINGNVNMERYLEMRKMKPEDFLFSEYRRLTQLCDEQKQKSSAMKKERDRAIKRQAAIEASVKETKSFQEEVKKMDEKYRKLCAQQQKKLDEQEKILSLKSVRAGRCLSRFCGRFRHR